MPPVFEDAYSESPDPQKDPACSESPVKKEPADRVAAYVLRL
jgi:hypothetical protein